MKVYTHKRRNYLILVFAVGFCGLLFLLVYSQPQTSIFSHFLAPSNKMTSEVMKINAGPTRVVISNASRSQKMKMTVETVLPGAECDHSSPSSLMEQSKRHIVQTVRDQWLFMNSQIRLLQRLFTSNDSLNKTYEKFQNTLQYMSAHGSEYARVLELEMNKLNHLDGYDAWRTRESKNLTETVRQRIHNLQNPENCNKAPVLLCDLTNDSGFASGMHDVLWCFVKAYQEKRRMILRASHWHYAPGEWEKIFQPLTDTCSNTTTNEKPLTLGNNNKIRGILRAIPQDLSSKIILLHGNPLAWWYGQFMAYLMRPSKELQSAMDRMKKEINFSAPIVGIHVRRTDKVGTEAKFHPLEAYMEHVENYFESLELESAQTVKRRVFIATDDPNVIKECNTKYPKYECLYNAGSAESATKIETRYGNNSLHNLVLDVYALAYTDYIVCTFSSGLGRLTFELMAAINEKSVDPSDRAFSLDLFHYYGYVLPPVRRAIYNHKPKSKIELPFKIGDTFVCSGEWCSLGAARWGKLTDGFSDLISTRKRTLSGRIPNYKTREIIEVVKF